MRKGTAKPAPMGNIHPVSDTVLQNSKKKCAGKREADAMIPMLRVEVKNDRPLICARELYEALGIKTQYSVWIDRIISLGFVSGQDFYPKMNKSTGGRCSVDHYITVDMAKHICMLLQE